MAPLRRLAAAVAIAPAVISTIAAPTTTNTDNDLQQLIFELGNDRSSSLSASWQSLLDDVAKPVLSTGDKIADALDRILSTIPSDLDATSASRALSHPPPGHPPFEVDFSDYTIWEILNATLYKHHDGDHDHVEGKHPHPPPPFKKPEDLPIHKLAWFVNKSEEVRELLDGKTKLTLLAPDDFALTPPKRPGHDDARKVGTGCAHHAGASDVNDGRRPHHREERHPLAKAYEGQNPLLSQDVVSVADDDDDERRERIIRLITFLLKYHISEEVLTLDYLLDRNTLSTLIPSARIRIDTHPSWTWKPLPGPKLQTTFNFLADKRGPVIIAKNGVIHTVSKPILPPLPPFEEIAVFPGWFSTFASGTQLVKLDEVLKNSTSSASVAAQQDAELLNLAHSGRHSVPAAVAQIFGGDDEGVNSNVMDILNDLVDERVQASDLKDRSNFTVFLPSNRAFRKFGWEINAFLFSPFGHRLLRYVLSYHIVPDVIVYSDYVANNSAGFKYDREIDVELPREVLDLSDPHPPRHLPRAEEPRRRSSFGGLTSFIKSVSPFGRAPSRPASEAFPIPIPGHHHPTRGNITHLYLPTLANTTLNVDVFATVVGPPPHFPGPRGIKRWIVAKPHAVKAPWWKPGKDGKPVIFDPKIPVTVKDAPAFKGSIHVVPEVLLPPKPERKKPDGDDGEKVKEIEMEPVWEVLELMQKEMEQVQDEVEMLW